MPGRFTKSVIESLQATIFTVLLAALFIFVFKQPDLLGPVPIWGWAIIWFLGNLVLRFFFVNKRVPIKEK